MMRNITILQPKKIVFGNGCIKIFQEDYLKLGYKKLFVLTAPPVRGLFADSEQVLRSAGVEIAYYDDINAEPTVTDFRKAVAAARDFGADSIVGLGGGSVLDLTKLVATLLHSSQDITTLFGTGLIAGRGVWFACMPTTAGTGSEVSPNAILLDEADRLKKGIVSEYLITDAAYADPLFTLSVPPRVTADTGMDALTHCIEAFTNKFAHPMVDIYAEEGIRLISANLQKAVEDPHNEEARQAVALGSLYGGLCLGPVNTAAVHALSYPLGGEYHIPHGLSNAILLPSVMRFNCDANVSKYARVAVACGVEPGADDRETAQRGVEFIETLSRAVGIPAKLTDLNIPQEEVPHLAEAAMQVQRLLRNNPREVTLQNAIDIYNSLY